MRIPRGVGSYWLALLLMAGSLAAEARPDVVVILADDLGFADLGCYGSEIPTPVLDGLAATGLRMTDFSNAARCCPSRAALLTGRSPHAVGLGGMVQAGPGRAYQGFLDPAIPTLAEHFAGAGYRTIGIGKWHVGHARPHWPVDRGFQESWCFLDGATDAWAVNPGRLVRGDADTDLGGRHLTDAIADETVTAITKARAEDRPFLAYVAFTAPHFPLQAPAEDIARFRGQYRAGWAAIREARFARQRALGLLPTGTVLGTAEDLPPWPTEDAAIAAEDLRMAVYAAMVAGMDRAIGRILAACAAQPRPAGTLILFCSDNGGSDELPRQTIPGRDAGPSGSYQAYGRGWSAVSNTPFRRHKKWLHQGGMASPCIVSWPGRLPAGRLDTTTLGTLQDVLPTLSAAADIPVPPGTEGVDLIPAWCGAPAPERTVFWEHFGRRAVRHGPWKLVGGEDRPWELYHLHEDPTEMVDRAAGEPARVAALAGRWQTWAKEVGVRPVREVLAAMQANAKSGPSE